MKYCAHCGQELEDQAMFCPKCGTPASNTVNQSTPINTMPSDSSVTPTCQNKSSSTSDTLKLVAFILCLISTISTGWLLLPLAWMLPLTITVYKGYKGEREISVAVKVCVLIFVNLIGGILLLVDNE